MGPASIRKHCTRGFFLYGVYYLIERNRHVLRVITVSIKTRTVKVILRQFTYNTIPEYKAYGTNIHRRLCYVYRSYTCTVYSLVPCISASLVVSFQ